MSLQKFNLLEVNHKIDRLEHLIIDLLEGDPNKLLDVGDVADRLKLTKSTIYKMSYSKAKTKLPFKRVGGKLLISERDLMQWYNTLHPVTENDNLN